MPVLLLAAALSPCAVITDTSAESRRIEVYPVSQQYHDVVPGDTLGEIAARLLPDNTHLQQKLQQEIVSMNPDAFVNGNPDRLLAGKRLWLPNSTVRPPSTETRGRVETFQWGSIRRPE